MGKWSNLTSMFFKKRVGWNHRLETKICTLKMGGFLPAEKKETELKKPIILKGFYAENFHRLPRIFRNSEGENCKFWSVPTMTRETCLGNTRIHIHTVCRFCLGTQAPRAQGIRFLTENCPVEIRDWCHGQSTYPARGPCTTLEIARVPHDQGLWKPYWFPLSISPAKKNPCQTEGGMLGKIFPVKQPISDGWNSPKHPRLPLGCGRSGMGKTWGGGVWDGSFGGFFGPQK